MSVVFLVSVVASVAVDVRRLLFLEADLVFFAPVSTELDRLLVCDFPLLDLLVFLDFVPPSAESFLRRDEL